MDWIRGGEWEVVDDDDNPQALAVLLKVGTALTTHEVWGAPNQFHRSGRLWDDQIGAQFALERYQVTAAIVWEMVDRVIAIPEPNWYQDEIVVNGEFSEKLLGVLKAFGPLGDVGGITLDTAMLETTVAPDYSVRLIPYYFRVDRLCRLLERSRTVFTTEARDEFRRYRLDQQEFEQVALFRESGIRFEAAPRTLGAFAGAMLIGRTNVPAAAVCKYCGVKFELTITPGATPSYCPEHRASKYRKRVLRGTAPAS